MNMRRIVTAGLLITATTLTFAAPSGATTYFGLRTDPADSAPDTDVRSVGMTIDKTNGIWDTDLVFTAGSTSSTYSTAYITYYATYTAKRCLLPSGGLRSLTGQVVVAGPLSGAGYVVVTMKGTKLSGTVNDGCLLPVPGAPKPTLGFARNGTSLKVRVRDRAITTMVPRGAGVLRLSAYGVPQETVDAFAINPLAGT